MNQPSKIPKPETGLGIADPQTWFKTIRYKGHEVKINAAGTVVYIDNRLYKISETLTRRGTHKVQYAANKTDTFYIPRLVATAFVANPKKYPLVLHLDQISTNNVYTNLIWGNSKRLQKLREKLDLKNGHPNYIDKKAKLEIVKRLKKGEFAKTLAAEFNVSHATITRIRKKHMREKHGNKRYHTEVKELVVKLLSEGFTSKEISTSTGICYETIWKWSKRPPEEVINSPCGHLKLKDLKPKS
jgi:hypothetical protein